MEELSGMRAEIGNDANVAALGEMWLGAGKGRKNIVMVTLGTGVGGGIIVDGKIVTGHHGAGGEIGHANVDHHETESCNCGNRGCLEQYASATGIVRMAKKELAASGENSVLRDAEEISAKAVLDAFKENDPVAVATMEKVGEQLGGALAIICCVTDPFFQLYHYANGFFVQHLLLYREDPGLSWEFCSCSSTVTDQSSDPYHCFRRWSQLPQCPDPDSLSNCIQHCSFLVYL